MDFSLIVACSIEGGIGKDNQIPWRIPHDLQHFKTVTSKCPIDKMNVVVMGRKTWESLPMKPLPNRINVIVSTLDLAEIEGIKQHDKLTVVAKSFQEALDKIEKMINVHNVFIIGGSRLYEEALKHTLCKKLFITHILKSFECDVYLPLHIVKDGYTLTREGSINSYNGIDYTFCEYEPFKI
jgi:dihydrofolate reductase